jgi:hypothetical protein
MARASTPTAVARRAAAHAKGTRARCIGLGIPCWFHPDAGTFFMGLMLFASCSPSCETCAHVRDNRCTQPHVFDLNATPHDRLAALADRA